MTSFTLRLIGIRCVTAQEANGDELTLQIDGETVWSAAPFHMSQHLSNLTRISEVDFEQGRRLTMNGWEAIPNFDAASMTFPNRESSTSIRLYEHDRFGDDFLGEVIAGTRDAGGGRIQIAFTQDGAHYILMYQVTT